MFKNLLKTEYFKLVSDSANEGIIKQDREKYTPVFNLIKKTLENDNKIIISDPVLISDDINNNTEHRIIDSINIYTIYTRRTATLLANVIHEHISKYVNMRSIIPLEEYEIMYNMRSIVKVYRIDKYKNIIITKLFQAKQINNLFYFPAEIELIDVYNKLYLPNYRDEWEDLLNLEKTLYKKIILNKVGGKCTDCKTDRKLDINNIKMLLMKFFDKENYIMVGKWAHNIITEKKDIENDYNIQILSENSIEDDYNNIMGFLSVYTNYGIYYKKKKIYIPKDTRIFKYTLFIKYPILGKKGKCVDKQFLDIYNCASYELIPYIKKTFNKFTINVGNLFVQLRFLFIDMWLINLLKYLDIVESSQFKYKYSDIINTILELKNIMPIDFKNSYLGINYDKKIEQKIVISEKNINKINYYPEFDINEYKKYKIVATSS